MYVDMAHEDSFMVIHSVCSYQWVFEVVRYMWFKPVVYFTYPFGHVKD